MALDYTDLIWTKENSLDKEFCKSLIEKFEEDENKYDGTTAFGLRKKMKVTTDLSISADKKWSEDDSVIHKALSSAILEYEKFIWAGNKARTFIINRFEYSDSGYKIQKYTLNENPEETGFYDWHNDFWIDNRGTRILVFMWYLNDVEEGGETEFCNGLKIKPEAGKLVIFPASWYIVHRGNKPISNDKIICNGWIYGKMKDLA